MSSSKTYPYPAELTSLDDESEYRDTLRDIFERFGWSVETEVSSDCGSCRADLIVQHPKWGTVGIECKYGNEVRPRMWAKALKQVQRYSDVLFNSGEIDRWAVSVEARMDPDDDLFDYRSEWTGPGYREFMNVMGYGVLQTHTNVELIFNYSAPMVKFPVAQIGATGELMAPTLRRLEECDTSEAHEY